MSESRPILTLDANVFVGALKESEPSHSKCVGILKKIPNDYLLAEPSIVYQEVCGTLARRIGIEEAQRSAKDLNRFIPRELLFDCDKFFCLSSYPLCLEYGIYSIDALYLRAAINAGSILVSLDQGDFIDKLKKNRQNVEVFHVSEFPG
ncbi:MAG TPA: PIN domain-containing protein [Nitrososphaerales archaeon]|nr:PIN domain-containing protein [Nitrososphaerales archaeon]